MLAEKKKERNEEKGKLVTKVKKHKKIEVKLKCEWELNLCVWYFFVLFKKVGLRGTINPSCETCFSCECMWLL